MNFKKGTSLLLFSAMLISLSAQNSGQNYTISPYSNFGLGELLQTNFAQAGSASQTWGGAYSYSLLNPATITNLKFATFDFGANWRRGLIESGTNKRTFSGGSLNYISLGFPIKQFTKRVIAKDSDGKPYVKKSIPFAWNSYFALYPNTSVGYNYTYENTVPFPTSTAHSGKGGVNTLEFGNGIKLGKSLSVGYSIGFMFGQITDKSLFTVPDSFDLAFVEDEKTVNIRGLQQQIGLMYQFKADSSDFMHRFGLSYRLYNGMKASTARLARSIEIQNNSYYIIDTIANSGGSYQGISVPSGIGAGYMVQWRDKINLSLDYRRQTWGNYSAYFQPNANLTTRNDYAAMVTFFPNDEKGKNEKRHKPPIRIGGRYSQTQNVLTGTTNTKIGVNETNYFVGFGIPLTRRYFNNSILRSVIHVQLDYITRGKNSNGLAKEQYFVATVGFNLGDLWFQRQKFGD